MNFTQGQDNATQSEAALSSGGSTAGGLLGISEMMITIKLTQNIANRLRTQLLERLTRLSMQTLDDHRIGDSIYRVMYDAPMIPDICYKLGRRRINHELGQRFTSSSDCLLYTTDAADE